QGLTISCEDPHWMAAAEKLAEALRNTYGQPVRITRTSPRITGRHHFLWNDGRNFQTIEQPDIVLGNRDASHSIAQWGSYPPGMGPHSARLPVMASETFPGPGRAVLCLLRPWTKDWRWPPSTEKQENG